LLAAALLGSPLFSMCIALFRLVASLSPLAFLHIHSAHSSSVYSGVVPASRGGLIKFFNWRADTIRCEFQLVASVWRKILRCQPQNGLKYRSSRGRSCLINLPPGIFISNFPLFRAGIHDSAD
jgi:hypothetical protein